MKINRRKFIATGAAGGLTAAGTALGATNQQPTPNEIEGPFYPIVAQKDKDFDLTQVESREGMAKGRHIMIIGEVVDTSGEPVEDATVDLWQANAEGRYRHPYDSSSTPLDDNFQGWAIVPSGKDGAFRFKTVFPGTYPAAKGWMRPAHIHFKVSKRGFVELITQMYFAEQELNDVDLLLKRKSDEEQKLMVAQNTSGEVETYHYRIVVERA